jgi:hypothetical protein
VSGNEQPNVGEIAMRCKDMVVEELLIVIAKELTAKNDVERIEERMATRDNLQKLEERMVRLEERTAKLEERMSRIKGQLSLSIKLFIVFNVSLLVGFTGLLLELLARKP